MPQTALELVLNLSEHIGKAGIDHLSARLRPLPQLPTLPQLPQLAPVPGAPPALAALATGAAAAVAPAAPEPSYAAEFGMEDTAIACWPCTQRHVNTVLVTAEAGAADPTEDGRRASAATVLGEIDVWRRYDVTADKLQRTPAGKRAAVTAAVPGMTAVRSALQPPPADLHLAWAAAGEAERFLRGEPTPLERGEAEERLQDVHGWVGRADTLPLPPAAAPHLRALRSARHRLNREGPTHAATVAMRDALRDAAVALTPDPGPAALATAAAHARAARGAFRRGALGAIQAGPAAPPRAPAPRAYVDRDARLPEAMATAYLDERPGPVAAGLGATPATSAAFARLAALSAARGVPVRDEPLPAEYAIEDGQVVYTGSILGAYAPSEDIIYVGTQAPVAAARDVEMLAEEVAHSLLDSPRCNRWRSPPGTDYDTMPEEREAKLASLLALLDAGLPIETSTGRTVDPARVRLRLEAIERGEDPRIVQRAQWAAGVMARALRGDVRGAAAASAACPLAG